MNKNYLIISKIINDVDKEIIVPLFEILDVINKKQNKNINVHYVNYLKKAIYQYDDLLSIIYKVVKNIDKETSKDVLDDLDDSLILINKIQSYIKYLDGHVNKKIIDMLQTSNIFIKIIRYIGKSKTNKLTEDVEIHVDHNNDRGTHKYHTRYDNTKDYKQQALDTEEMDQDYNHMPAFSENTGDEGNYDLKLGPNPTKPKVQYVTIDDQNNNRSLQDMLGLNIEQDELPIIDLSGDKIDLKSKKSNDQIELRHRQLNNNINKKTSNVREDFGTNFLDGVNEEQDDTSHIEEDKNFQTTTKIIGQDKNDFDVNYAGYGKETTTNAEVNENQKANDESELQLVQQTLLGITDEGDQSPDNSDVIIHQTQTTNQTTDQSPSGVVLH